MATLQVKGLDDDLYKALGRRAARDNRSVSQEVVTIIKEFLARPPGRSQANAAELLELGGSWEDERSPAEIAREVRKARRTGARFGKGRRVFD